MFWNEHAPPHFHALYGEHEALIDVRDLHVMRGSLPHRAFEPLRSPAVFARAGIVLGAVQWPDGADLAPDVMYDAIRKHGVWVLD